VEQPSILEAHDQYLQQLRRTGSSALYDAYQLGLAHFIKFLKDDPSTPSPTSDTASLGVGDALAFLRHLQSQFAVESEHLYSRALLDFLTFADGQGWTSFDLKTLTQSLTDHRRTKEHTPPSAPLYAIDTILAYVEQTPIPPKGSTPDRQRLQMLRDKAFIPTLADTGLRTSEICDLRIKDIDLINHIITPPHSSISLPVRKSTSSAINRYLSTREALLPAASTHNESLPVFSRHDKRASDNVLPISRWTAANIINTWTRLALSSEQIAKLDEANESISPLTFRHYFVITTLKSTKSLTKAQELARHHDESTTRRYLDAAVDNSDS
jgi:integrase